MTLALSDYHLFSPHVVAPWKHCLSTLSMVADVESVHSKYLLSWMNLWSTQTPVPSLTEALRQWLGLAGLFFWTSHWSKNNFDLFDPCPLQCISLYPLCVLPSSQENFLGFYYKSNSAYIENTFLIWICSISFHPLVPRQGRLPYFFSFLTHCWESPG